jgi:uncharacterized protein (DUF697 family)
MRLPIPFGSLLVLVAIQSCCAEIINFDRAAVGVVPADWTVAMTHKGGPPKWEIFEDNEQRGVHHGDRGI